MKEKITTHSIYIGLDKQNILFHKSKLPINLPMKSHVGWSRKMEIRNNKSSFFVWLSVFTTPTLLWVTVSFYPTTPFWLNLTLYLGKILLKHFLERKIFYAKQRRNDSNILLISLKLFFHYLYILHECEKLCGDFNIRFVAMCMFPNW